MEANKFKDLAKTLEQDPKQLEAFKENPVQFLEQIKERPIDNKGVFLTIVIIVGVVLVGSIILGSIIIFRAPDTQNAKVPEFLVSVGSTALGAIVGLLAPTPNK